MRSLCLFGFTVKGIGLLFAILIQVQCKKISEKGFEIDPAFTEKIAAFTSGVISSESPVQIVLAEEMIIPVELNTAIEIELFSFKPKVKGHVYWLDKRTLEFRPDEKFKSGQTYNARFFLSKLTDVPSELKTFEFQFSIIQQNFNLSLDGFQCYDQTSLKWNRIIGTLTAADVTDIDQLNRIVIATQGNKELKIKWDPSGDSRLFSFSVDSVIRSEKNEFVEISWDGGSIGINSKGKQKLEIPALGDFKVMSVKVNQHPEQYLSIQFSDPVRKNQNLDGLILLENFAALSFTVDGNIIKAFPAVRLESDFKLTIRKGVQNILGYDLKEEFIAELNFEAVKPSLRFAGNGVILPNSGGLVFPFEAVNLKAVDVKIIKIFESNIGHFLQVNRLDGSNQLKRAGRLIHKQKFTLNQFASDLSTWNVFYIDLEKFIKPDPGSIYRIELKFRNSYSLYPCENIQEEDSEELTDNFDELEDTDISYWDSYEDYYADYYEDEGYYFDYNWEERDNPCSKSYYTSNRFIARNILASDLGLIVKGDNNNNLLVSVSNLISTMALPNTQVNAYNFQQQLLASGTTDNNGLVRLRCDEKPFLLIASKDNQKGYLRLDDGSSLSLSQFDVSGHVVQKGLKGFMYGERGVWRPGDTIFLTFILEDRQKVLPSNHPVIFELYNPQGQIVNRIVKSKALNGFYSFAPSTRPDAPTGYWNAYIKVGGTEFSKSIKIETIKPNRLKINIDFGVDQLTVNDKTLLGDLSVTWLHGSPARNLRAKIDVTLTRNETSFKKYPDFKFTDPSRSFNAEAMTLFDGRISEDGKARVKANISADQRSPGMLKANLVTRVFEESGDFSADFFSMPYSPYISYVGIRPPEGDKRGMLLTDTLQWVDVVTIDNNGIPVSRSNLEVKVYQISWRYWWQSDEEDLSGYVGNNFNQPVISKSLSTINGKGRFSFRINRPDWGRFFIRVYDPVSGHAAGKIVYIDWPGWAGRPLRNDPQAATMLVFNAGKSVYNVGEKAEIIIPGSSQGRALVSLENGSSVIGAEWINITGKENRYTFDITPEMAPNIYVHITLIQPHNNEVNDMPIRLYGVIPLMIENPETRLQPVISMPEVLKPESEVTIHVSEKSRKQMTYTLAIVEDGLLDLTRFKTPDPWNAFYSREALGIKTWDLFDMVIGAYGGKLDRILSIGGDDEQKIESEGEKANRFMPVVIYLGPYNLAKGQTRSHTIKLPRYVGSVRTMIVAGAEGAYGFNEKSTPVSSPLMVLATMPRVIGPGEEVKLPVTVFSMEPSIKTVNVQLKTNDLLLCQDENSKNVSFSQTGDKIVSFSLKAPLKTGIGKVLIEATSGNNKASYEVELDVRPSNPEITKFYASVIDPGKSWIAEHELPGMAGTNTGILEVSSIPPLDIERRLHFLITYPHGCIEQTTSSVFPQLYLNDVMDLDENYKNSISSNIKAGIDRLKVFTIPSGGFGYWPGDRYANDWGSSYAGHFLLEAENKGFALPVGMKSSWLKHQKKMARQYKNVSSSDPYHQYDLEQAYRLYTLALAGEPEIGAMNRLRGEKNLSVQAIWRLAAAYALAGQPEIARQLSLNIATEVSPYNGFCTSYGSVERDWAMILETLVLLNDKVKAAPLVLKLSDRLSKDYWMSTQTTAYCLLSMAKFAGFAGTSKAIDYNFKFNDNKIIHVVTTKPLSKLALIIPKLSTKAEILLENKGQGLIYARIAFHGTPLAGKEKGIQQNLILNVDYKNINGTPIDVSVLNQGTDFLASVTVKNPSPYYYKNLAINHIFPSGWEIRNIRLYDFAQSSDVSIPDYQDFRDDRVLTYFNLSSGESQSFVVQLNAAYLGRFYLPAVSCEAMYDNSINASTEGQWIEVYLP
jgi:hypothetical protein